MNTLAELEEQIRFALGRPLPGPTAHLLLAPDPRPGWTPGQLPPDGRVGAALVLVYPERSRPHLILTVRARHLASHRGQVSFPGGAVEPGESVAEAALREASEEVGVDPEAVRILGGLTPLHIPASGFVLHPVLGVTDHRPDLLAVSPEVERILEVSLEELLEPARLVREERPFREGTAIVPYFFLGGERVWGATAMVLAELASMLGAPPGRGGRAS
jgi:8-oxo-dGTP pyrophosphatase MutT (NUDIX family)